MVRFLESIQTSTAAWGWHSGNSLTGASKPLRFLEALSKRLLGISYLWQFWFSTMSPGTGTYAWVTVVDGRKHGGLELGQLLLEEWEPVVLDPVGFSSALLSLFPIKSCVLHMFGTGKELVVGH